jgi:hypothetical protein
VAAGAVAAAVSVSEGSDVVDADADVVVVAFNDVVMVVLLAGPVLLFTNGSRGVKLYPSGPTLDTLDAGPTMISIA